MASVPFHVLVGEEVEGALFPVLGPYPGRRVGL